MDIAFRGLINDSVVVYLDDVMVYSRRREDHISHLRKIFERCRKYGISLNPKKSMFAVTCGKLLSFIISKDGIMIDLKRTQAINQIPFPISKKRMQSFFGQINFVKRFVSSFSEIVKPLQNMIKKDFIYKWGDLEKQSFSNIKKPISQASTLMSPDFTKDFILYTFSTKNSYAVVLTQENDEGFEVPISFLSSTFKNAELNYSDIDKQAFVVFKAVKHFRAYLNKSKTKVIVPYTAVRNLLVQKELGEKRAHWMTALQEFDLEIKPAKIVRGQGLCKLAAESIGSPDDDCNIFYANLYEKELLIIPDNPNSWYSDLKFLLLHGHAPEYLTPTK